MSLLSILASAVIAAASTMSPSGLVSRADGGLEMAVRWTDLKGTDHISTMTSTGESDWTYPRNVVSGNISGGSLFVTPDGSLHLFYSLDGVASHSVLSGRRWSKPQSIGKGLVNSAPVIAGNGNWVLAADSADGAFTFVSKDNGKSWTKSKNKVKVPQKTDTTARNPKLFIAPDGSVKMAVQGFRTAFCYYASSLDGGLTWDLPKRMIMSPDRDFAVAQVPQGRVVLIKNCRIDEVEFTRDDELYAYISANGGESWRKGIKVSGQKFSTNPVCCVDEEGKIYIAYRHQYQRSCKIELVVLENGKAGAPVTLASAGKAEKGYLRSVGGLLTPKSHWAKEEVKLVSYNTLRSQWSGGRAKWLPRFETICEHLAQFDGDFIGMQETSKSDIDDFKEVLKDYDYIAITPEIMGPSVSPERESSELPLWWRRSRFDLVKKGWLEFNIVNDVKCGANSSAESWGNGQDPNKSMIWGIFYDKQTKKKFCVMNLHLPTRSEPSKLATAKMVAEEAARVAEGLPVFITGDFNLTEKGFSFIYLEEDVEYLKDAGLALDDKDRKWWDYYSGAGLVLPVEKKTRDSRHVDHILYTPASAKPVRWETEIHPGSNGAPGSDHLPIVVTFRYAN